jgi:signal transduction histidine kinase
MPVSIWWDDLRARYATSDIDFIMEGDEPDSVTVPAALFNLATENMIANALDKRAGATTLHIRVTLSIAPTGVAVEVCDDGKVIAPALAVDLFRGPVPSETGMGIGLYQAARLLEHGGFALRLAANAPGRVCFRLAPMAR